MNNFNLSLFHILLSTRKAF